MIWWSQWSTQCKKSNERNDMRYICKRERDALCGLLDYRVLLEKNLPCKLVTVTMLILLTKCSLVRLYCVYIFFALENLESCELELIIWHSHIITISHHFKQVVVEEKSQKQPCFGSHMHAMFYRKRWTFYFLLLLSAEYNAF